MVGDGLRHTVMFESQRNTGKARKQCLQSAIRYDLSDSMTYIALD